MEMELKLKATQLSSKEKEMEQNYLEKKNKLQLAIKSIQVFQM